jgi:hypothetical protein
MLLWNQASADSIRAAEPLIKLEAREARLRGLDMPTKVAVTGPDGGIPLERMRRVMERPAAARPQETIRSYALIRPSHCSGRSGHPEARDADPKAWGRAP